MINQGDRVRFLNNVGGGVVTRVDRSKNLVFVEDEDGFEVPVLERECVAVPLVNENTNFPKAEQKQPYTSSHEVTNKNETIGFSREGLGLITNYSEVPREQIIETPEGDELNVMLAFIPQKIKELHATDFDLVLVNDSNYFLLFNLISGDGDHAESLASGRIEPNMQEEILSFDNRKLEKFSRLSVQVIAYKLGKTYKKQSVLDAYIKFDPIKFLKLHSYSTNDYFEDQALIFNLKNKS